MSPADLTTARREAARALDRWDSLPVTHRYDYEAAEVIRALRSLLAAPDGAGAKDCPDCGVTETATGWTLRRCNRHRIEMPFPAPSPASDEVREAAELLREVYDETDCGCDTATCRDTCLSAKVRAWLAALAARPAVAASDEVREEVLGTCELCRASRRRVHRELPNRFVECHGAGFVWLCKRCGRWNTAINNGKAICCTDPCERGGE